MPPAPDSRPMASVRPAEETSADAGPGMLGSLGAVTAGSMVANVAAYLVHLTAGRWWLGPADYGRFAVVLSALLVFAVPALALQSVVARQVVARGGRGLRRLTVGVVVAVLLVTAVGVPVVAALSSNGTGLVTAGLAAAPLLVVVGAGQGILQGRRRFRALAGVLGVVGVLRNTPMIVALALGAGPSGALGAGAVGTAVAALVVWVAVARSRARVGAEPTGAQPTAAAVSTRSPGLWTVVRAGQVQLVLVVATSADLLLAPTVLDRVDTGVYALGAIATKVAFWLPQAVGVVFYPRLADPATSADSFRRAVGVVTAIGAMLTLLAAAAGPLVPSVIGSDYRELTGWLWLFAVTGAALAVLQVGLLSAIARDRTVVAAVAWAGVAVQALLIVTLGASVPTVAAIAAAVSVAAAVTTTAAGLRIVDAGPADAPATTSAR